MNAAGGRKQAGEASERCPRHALEKHRVATRELAGFVSPEGKAYGRPVGVAIDKRGALLVVDDVGNAVWRVTG